MQTAVEKLIPQEQIDGIAKVYLDFDKAFNRTKSRVAIDGGILLLAILNELRLLREAMGNQGGR